MFNLYSICKATYVRLHYYTATVMAIYRITASLIQYIILVYNIHVYISVIVGEDICFL